MSAADVRPPGGDDSKSLKLDEGSVMHLRSLLYEQSDAADEIAAVEEEIDRCVRLELVPSWDKLRDWCERLSDAADTADKLPEILNYLLDDVDEQS